MKKTVLNFAFTGFVAFFAFMLLQPFNQASAEVAVKCRKSDTKGDYCYTSGHSVDGCANSTEKDNCPND